jgi:hypothetical protein
MTLLHACFSTLYCRNRLIRYWKINYWFCLNHRNNRPIVQAWTFQRFVNPRRLPPARIVPHAWIRVSFFKRGIVFILISFISGVFVITNRNILRQKDSFFTFSCILKRDLKISHDTLYFRKHLTSSVYSNRNRKFDVIDDVTIELATKVDVIDDVTIELATANKQSKIAATFELWNCWKWILKDTCLETDVW